MNQMLHEILPAPEYEAQRRQNGHEELHETDQPAGKGFRCLLGNAFWSDLAEHQHEQRHDDGRDGGAPFPVNAGEQNGRQGSRKNIDDVVSDQHGRKKLIVMIQNVQSSLGTRLAIIIHALELDLAGNGVRRFSCREYA